MAFPLLRYMIGNSLHRKQLQNFAVRRFEALGSIATGVDNHGDPGSLAADHAGSMNKGFVVEVFE